jgi:adenine-specific DNA-methyltransferase
MPKSISHEAHEPQALFEFTHPTSTPAVMLAYGGEDSFQVEPKGGRQVEKVRDLGQVATPRVIAQAMALWVMASKPDRVLDPAMGLGNLLQACRELNSTTSLEGVEIDPTIIVDAHRTAPTGTRLVCADYLKQKTTPFDGIIANPPYIKASRQGFTSADWEYLEDMLGINLDRLTNVYALFLLKIWHDLSPYGRAAVLVPAEFLNANYGSPIKAQLLQQIRPVATLVFDPSVTVFQNALTTTALLLLEKSAPPRDVLPALRIERIEDLTSAVGAFAHGDHTCTTQVSAMTDLSTLSPSDKWLGRILGHHTEHDSFTHKVGDFFRCSRGIATGANEYFCLRSSEIKTHDLDLSDFTPCVTKAPDVTGLIFNKSKWKQLAASDCRCWLLSPEKVDAAMKRYLTIGEASGVASKFLPSHRSVWYLPENRAPAAAWVAVFSRDILKCVLNQTLTRHLTCFHGVYAKPGVDADAARLVLFLNSSLGRTAIRGSNRFYGAGLNKLEPKDVESIPCPALGSANALIDSATLIVRLLAIEQLDAIEQIPAIDTLAEEIFGLTVPVAL